MGALLLLLGAAGVGIVAALLARPFAERVVVGAALERGIELVPGTLGLGFRRVTLDGATARLVGVPGVSARLRHVVVHHQWLNPTAVEADGVELEIEGSIAIITLDFAEWTRRYSKTYAGKLEARDVSLRWRERQGQEDWLLVKGASVRPRAGGGELRAGEATLSGVPLGRVATVWSRTDAEVEIGFGAESAGVAPVRLQVQHAAAQPKALVTLRPTDIERLGKAFGVEIPLPGVKVNGEADLLLPEGIKGGPIGGKLAMTLEGWVPPHPPELNGFVFGERTSFESAVDVSADRSLARLDRVRVKAGEFVLKGSGGIERLDTHALIKLSLRGDLRCTDLAGAAAESRLGRTIGRWVGTQAKSWVEGSVAVVVKVDADSRDLPNAKLLRTVGVGCGIKPIKLPGLGVFDFDDIDLGGVRLDRLPALPSALPPLPSAISFPVNVPPSAPPRGRPGADAGPP